MGPGGDGDRAIHAPASYSPVLRRPNLNACALPFREAERTNKAVGVELSLDQAANALIPFEQLYQDDSGLDVGRLNLRQVARTASCVEYERRARPFPPVRV
jgi:hypothetical protein